MSQNRSFTEYVADRFENELWESVETIINENPERLALNLRKVKTIDTVELQEINVEHVWTNDLPGMEISFDVAVSAEMEVRERDYHYDVSELAYKWFIVRFKGSLESDLNDAVITYKDVYSSKSRQKTPLDDALVPIINTEQLEEVADRILDKYYKDAKQQPIWVNPQELAKRMGLNVQEFHISRDSSIFGRIFFRATTTEIYDPLTDEMVPMDVSERTVFVDPDVFFQINLGAFNNTIVHECVHWELHRKAFALARLYNKDLAQIGCKVAGGIVEGKWDSTDWMEWQANSLAPKIQMPLSMFKQRTEELITKFRRETDQYDVVDIIQPIIEQLHTDFAVSKLAAKIRLVDIGYDEAIGAFVFIDGRYVQPHKAAPGFLKRNQTFSIPVQDAAILTYTSPHFREIITKGGYVYVDSHFVINHEKYITRDASGTTVLTHYARNHMDECALVFDLFIKSAIGERYHSECFLNQDKASPVVFDYRFTGGYENANKAKQLKVLKEVREQEAELCLTLPDDYMVAMRQAMEWRGKMEGIKMTAVEIAKRAEINESTVRRILNEYTGGTVNTFILFCLALHLPYRASRKIIDNCPHHLIMTNKNHQWYDFALQIWYGLPVEEVKNRLAAVGADPL